MKKIVECVPNYSIGSNWEVLDKIVEPFKISDQVKLLSVEPDDDYNRTVVTVLGEVNEVIKAMVKSAKIASELIDLRVHQGQHKRMGAIDVIPLIPISNIDVSETIEYTKQLADLINKETNIPIFLYSLSATADNRKSLPDIRKGEFEGMAEKTKLAEWKPDYGNGSHVSCGVTAVGCRPLLVAYNIDLDTKEIAVAREISKAIRFSSGGYRFIQAGPVQLDKRNIVQVTMNVTDYTKTSVYRAFEAVKMEARRYGIEVKTSEFVGLVSLDCLKDIAAYYLKLNSKDDVKLELDEIVNIVTKELGLYGFDKTKVIDYYVD